MNLWLTNPHGVDTEEDRMNRRERKQARREEREKERKAAEEAARPPAHFDTGQEANTALADTAHIINMKERQKAKEAKTMKTAAAAAKSTTATPKSANPKPRQSATGLPAMPALPKARKNRPENPCECGCGTTTKSKFAPGHDSYLKGWVIRVERGVVKLAEVPDFCRPKVAAMIKARKGTAEGPATGKAAAVKAEGGKPNGKIKDQKAKAAKAAKVPAPLPEPDEDTDAEGDEASEGE